MFLLVYQFEDGEGRGAGAARDARSRGRGAWPPAPGQCASSASAGPRRGLESWKAEFIGELLRDVQGDREVRDCARETWGRVATQTPPPGIDVFMLHFAPDPPPVSSVSPLASVSAASPRSPPAASLSTLPAPASSAPNPTSFSNIVIATLFGIPFFCKSSKYSKGQRKRECQAVKGKDKRMETVVLKSHDEFLGNLSSGLQKLQCPGTQTFVSRSDGSDLRNKKGPVDKPRNLSMWFFCGTRDPKSHDVFVGRLRSAPRSFSSGPTVCFSTPPPSRDQETTRLGKEFVWENPSKRKLG